MQLKTLHRLVRYFTVSRQAVLSGLLTLLLVLLSGLPRASAGELRFMDPKGVGEIITPIPLAIADYSSLAGCSAPSKAGSFYALTSDGEVVWIYPESGLWTGVSLIKGKYSKLCAVEDGSGFLFALAGDAIYRIGWLGEWSPSKLVDGHYRAIASNRLEGQNAFCFAVSQNGEIVLIGWDSAQKAWAETKLVYGDYTDILQLPTEGHPIYALRSDGGIDRVIQSKDDGRWRQQPVLDGKFKSLLCPGVNAAQQESLLVLNERGEAQLATFDGLTCKLTPFGGKKLQAAIVKQGESSGYFIIKKQ